MKEQINTLRERLHLAIEEADKEKILKISKELDKLISIYYNIYYEKEKIYKKQK